MPKIPPKNTIADGVKILADVYAEIDKQLGKETSTVDDKVSDAEVASFLRQRGAKSETAGAAVATVNAYLKHMHAGDVSVADIKKTLDKVTGYVDRDREKGLEVAEMKPTWRAIALFSAEVANKGLTAREIVSDRSKLAIGDLAHAKAGLDVMSAVMASLKNVDGVKKFTAGGPNTVATAKDAVRALARYLEGSTKQTEWTKAQIDGALKGALAAMTKNAAGANDRAALARTWQALLAFADENALRKKDASQIVGALAAAPAATGLPTTLDAFRKLDTDAKLEVLDDYGNLRGHYVTSGEKKIDELTGKAQEFAKKMHKELVSLVGDFEEDSGVYGTIGSPEVRAEVISLPNGDVVGGRVWCFQKGFNAETAPEVNGETPYHFDTVADCEKAGVDAHEDISWQVHGLFEATATGAVQLGESYEHVSDYWEWSGY